MNTVEIPLWINLISVVGAFVLVCLMARWERSKFDSTDREGVVVELRKGEDLPGKPPFKKAA